MAPRKKFRPVNIPFDPPSVIDGNTIYNTCNPLVEVGAPGWRTLEKVQTWRLKRELQREYQGDLGKMGEAKGFHSDFMKLKQSLTVDPFTTEGQEIVARKRREADAKILLSLSSTHPRPVTTECKEAIAKGTHGTTPKYRQKLQLKDQLQQIRRDGMASRETLSHARLIHRAASAFPD
ncbi:hypothetical protein T484DRAFT_1887592, partial [Baffinella frigidus]